VKAFALTVLFLFSGLTAGAWDASLSLPAPAPVVDEYGLLPKSDARQLDQLLRTLKERSGVEISVFIPSSLRGLAIEDFSIRTAEEWKLGRKKEDKALLLVVAPKERKMRIEVGYGLEGDITDAFSRRVLDDAVKPYFLKGAYSEGILAGLAAIQEKVPLGLREGEAPPAGTGMAFPLPLIIILLVILISVLSALGRLMGFRSYGGYGGGYWGGGGWGGGSWGGGSGGSWGGGGGGFGGGGASSNW
jgi:uncharacterized protein